LVRHYDGKLVPIFGPEEPGGFRPVVGVQSPDGTLRVLGSAGTIPEVSRMLDPSVMTPEQHQDNLRTQADRLNPDSRGVVQGFVMAERTITEANNAELARILEQTPAEQRAEIAASTEHLPPPAPPAPVRDALHNDSPARELSPHDQARAAELKELHGKLGDPAHPDAEAKIKEMLTDFGLVREGSNKLRNDGPAMQRRMLIEHELGVNLDTIAHDVGLTAPPPRHTDNEGLPLRGQHADPDAVPRRDVTHAEVDAALPPELAAALEKFGLNRETVVNYIVEHHNDRSRQRYLPDLAGLAREYAGRGMTPAEVMAIDLYTTKLFYEQLNKRMRTRVDVDTAQDLQNLLNGALSKLPEYGGSPIYRTLELPPDVLTDFLAQHPVGAVKEWGGFTSVAGDITGTFWNRPEANVLFEIHGATSHDISDFADGIHYKDPPQGGPELFMPGGVQVRVKSVTESLGPTGEKRYTIQLEQLPRATTAPHTAPSHPPAPPRPGTRPPPAPARPGEHEAGASTPRTTEHVGDETPARPVPARPPARTPTERTPTPETTPERAPGERTPAIGRPLANNDSMVEQLAHGMVAKDLTPEDIAFLRANGYEAQNIVRGTRELVMRTFLPTEAGKPPIVAFRGTVPSKVHTLIADADPRGIGIYQFEPNRELIDHQVQLAAQHGPILFSGHSLGGALAQTVASHYPGQVSHIVTFQAPGVSRETAARIEDFNAAHPEHPIESTHHRVKGDLVPLGGEALTPGVIHNHELVGGSRLSRNPLAKHLVLPLAQEEIAAGHQVPVHTERQTVATTDGTVAHDNTHKTQVVEHIRAGVGRLLFGAGSAVSSIRRLFTPHRGAVEPSHDSVATPAHPGEHLPPAPHAPHEDLHGQNVEPAADRARPLVDGGRLTRGQPQKMSDEEAMLVREAEAAWNAWLASGAVPNPDGSIVMTSPGGIRFGGSVKDLTPPYELATIFIEA
ncbi:MAG TPA: hypothetical protein VFK02_25145, partial [Kofleriaceae bacterium]|nr:hypothetical protein [Kofleriaceae bacterium]